MVNGLESSGKMKEYIAIIARYTISFVTVITILNCANFLISFLLLTLTVMKYTMILTIAKNNKTIQSLSEQEIVKNQIGFVIEEEEPIDDEII